MKQLAALEYTFIFEPSETWQHAYQFEQDLADFFAAHGKEANKIKTVDGGAGRGMIYIRKIEPMIQTPKNPVGRPKEVKGILNDLRQHKPTARERNFKQGELVRTKGYIKHV